jgi:hypothetical protein
VVREAERCFGRSTDPWTPGISVSTIAVDCPAVLRMGPVMAVLDLLIAAKKRMIVSRHR